MPEEFALLASRFGAQKIQAIGPREFLVATSGAIEVVLVCSRIGKVAAASTATTLIQSFGVDAVLLTGVAGGIGAHAKIGDIVVARSLVQYDIDLKGVMGYRRFDIPLLDRAELAPCAELTKIVEASAGSVLTDPAYTEVVSKLALRTPSAHTGLIASGDRFINEAHERKELKALLPELLCVEMEGAAVAQVCVEQGVPFAVARIISDSADIDAAFDFKAFIQSAAAVGADRLVAGCIARLA